MRLRDKNLIEKCWAMFIDWHNDNSRGNENQALVAKTKAVEKLKKVTKCEHFLQCDLQNVACKSCHGIEKEICSFIVAEIKAEDEKQKKERKRKKRTTTRPWLQVIEALKAGTARKEIIQQVKELFKTESSCKSFVASCGCAYNALNGKSTKKGGVVFLYAEWLKNNCEGAEPEGDSSSKSYVRNVFDILKKMNAESADIA